MLTKKLWNSYSSETRKEIIETIYGTSGNHPHLKSLIESAYNHNFDFNAYGATLKKILSMCNLQKDGTVNVTVTITPKSAKDAPKPKIQEPESKVWYIDYNDKHGDLCHIWCEAESREKAIDYLHSEYWDVEDIISVIPKR